ncbi:glucosaminidase domain-containing protein [Capnocytophaga sp. ARDL2]|uniref:glucosaminidase domain-containing protein n=1 Tax=Capnocytophaga sp. ARDL2 TaxID=3238809 RepID=UPI003556FCB2
MKSKFFYILLLLIFTTLTINAQQHKYIQTHLPLAEELSQQYKIPLAIILAIAFVETGAGSSKGAKVYNNHFGIVGKNTVVKSRYKSFASTKESFVAFCEMVSRKKYYQNLKGTNDYDAWITAMANAGYSTRPTEWKRRIRQIIKQEKL